MIRQESAASSLRCRQSRALAKRVAVDAKLPGFAYGVIIDGELVLAGGVGFADVEKKVAVTDATLFRIASMTKSFTALAILKLRDAGKLSLDEPVSKYVPELAFAAPPPRDSPRITIRHLLTHTAGFPEDNPVGDRWMGLTSAEFTALLRRGIPLSTTPGTELEYSNLGFAILGRVVARVSGTSLRAIRAAPDLGAVGDARHVLGGARGAGRSHGGGIPARGRRLRPAPLADGGDSEFIAIGGIITSVRDLSRWVALMLSAYPPRDEAEHPVASRRTLREMQTGSRPGSSA
jgi:CubicO group peptidase (beta-lactamase class C family)